MKILVQEYQLLDAQSATFADVDKRFRACNDMVFVIDRGIVAGIITQYDYLKFYFNNTAPDYPAVDIANKHFISVTESEMDRQTDRQTDRQNLTR